jgi:protein subunit release factor B
MEDLHLTKKDFKIDWYSGSGGGGQHRNKHQNCCRITHLETGLTSIGTSFKERERNKIEAFENLAKKIINYYREDREELDLTEVVRNYNEKRNEVHDKLSGLKEEYKKVVLNNDISEMIKARKKASILKNLMEKHG